VFERTRKTIKEIVKSIRKQFLTVQVKNPDFTFPTNLLSEVFSVFVYSWEGYTDPPAHSGEIGTIAQESILLNAIPLSFMEIEAQTADLGVSRETAIHAVSSESFLAHLRNQPLSPQTCRLVPVPLPKAQVERKSANMVIHRQPIHGLSLDLIPKTIRNPRWFWSIMVTRHPASRSEYPDYEIQKGLRFIMKRLDPKSKFRVLGVYRDVPIDRIDRIQFLGKEMQFSLKEPTGRDVILDVIIVRDEEEKRYHVGPIVRKA
jgi:hypothetical protein